MRIFETWGINNQVDYKMLEQQITSPSKTTVAGSAITGNKQIEQWTTKLSKEQKERMTKVLNYFEVNVYTEDPYPIITFK